MLRYGINEIRLFNENNVRFLKQFYPSLMTLWTIQSKQAWESMETSGTLRGDSVKAEPSFFSAYEWMSRQMKLRIGPSSDSTANPLWAWYQWRGERQRKPDLRAGGHLEKGAMGVRIEFEANERRVLLSDFDLWHYVLNYWFLPVSEAEGDRFEAKLAAKGLSFFKTKPLPNGRYHRVIEASWQHIFDLDFKPTDIAVPRKQKCVQACLWEIGLDQVSDVGEFKAR